MSKKDFHSVDQILALITKRRKTVSGRQLSWLNFQRILYNRNEPYALRIKEYDADESSEYLLISLLKKNGPTIFPRFKLKRLYRSRPPSNVHMC